MRPVPSPTARPRRSQPLWGRRVHVAECGRPDMCHQLHRDQLPPATAPPGTRRGCFQLPFFKAVAHLGAKKHESGTCVTVTGRSVCGDGGRSCQDAQRHGTGCPATRTGCPVWLGLCSTKFGAGPPLSTAAQKLHWEQPHPLGWAAARTPRLVSRGAVGAHPAGPGHTAASRVTVRPLGPPPQLAPHSLGCPTNRLQSPIPASPRL